MALSSRFVVSTCGYERLHEDGSELATHKLQCTNSKLLCALAQLVGLRGHTSRRCMNSARVSRRRSSGPFLGPLGP
jgi:hypothetical protein